MARETYLIQFYLTNMCNSRCKTCEIWKNKERLELPFEHVKSVIDEFPFADYVFGGGELTLYSDKDKLLKYCDENNINYTILSNAVSINLLEDLLAAHEVKNLTISCDGKNHDEIRGVKGNLKNIVDMLDDKIGWRNHIPNIKLSYTLSKMNEGTIDEDMEFFKSLGFNKIYFCIAQNMDLLKAGGDITPSRDSIRYLYENHSDMLYDKDKQLLGDLVNGIHRKCDSTNCVFTIYTNGDVVRCQSYMSKDVLGNIKKRTLYEILNSDIHYVTNTCIDCIYNDICELVCQRRYDYEDRL